MSCSGPQVTMPPSFISARWLANRAASLDHVSGGRMEPVKPAALRAGTVVELRDLFFATPARLKFLRSDRAEGQAVSDVVKRLAMAQFDEATLQGIDLYLGLLQRLVTSSVLTALALPFIVPFIMDSLTFII